MTLAPVGLRLHPDKTRIVCLRQGKEGFDFLGFHHRMKESLKYEGRYYLQKWPSDRAMASIRAKIRARTPRGYAGRDLAYVVEDLNPVLRGWGAYYRHGNSTRKFTTIDSYVHQRLAKLASVKHGISGRNWTTRDPGRGLRLTTLPFSHLVPKSRTDALPDTLLRPAHVVAVHGVPVRVVGRQRSPLTTRGGHVEDGVHDVALVPLGGASHATVPRVGRDQIGDQLPLLIGQVTLGRPPSSRNGFVLGSHD
jgi:hypothetical protein